MVDEKHFFGPTDSWPKHQSKDVQAVLEEARGAGWWLRKPQGHWGVLYCGRDGDRRGESSCAVRIDGTPQSPAYHAIQVRRRLKKCRHRDTDEE